MINFSKSVLKFQLIARFVNHITLTGEQTICSILVQFHLIRKTGGVIFLEMLEPRAQQ